MNSSDSSSSSSDEENQMKARNFRFLTTVCTWLLDEGTETAHHDTKHGFPGMIGSLDCTHWPWRNCPREWRGAYTRGDYKRLTIMLEATASQDTWFWHAFFGPPGSNNDINVLDRSHLFSNYLDGTTPHCPFLVNGIQYRFGYYLGDEIYPRWATIVKTLSHPNATDTKRQRFKQAQEAARKDIERALARLLAHEVADLCLGKPPLKSLSASATVRHALTALNSTNDNHISIWNCNHHNSISDQLDCRCIGKICMVDIICYLCNDDNLTSPSTALDSPVSVLLSADSAVVRHVDPATSLVEAIDLIINGAQNLVVPISSRTTINSKRKQILHDGLSFAPTTHAGGGEFCWLTQEDVIRFLLNSIALFSPTAAYSVEYLGIIDSDILTVNYHSPASTAVEQIRTSLADQTSVAVIDDEGILIGEISPFTLAYCDETAAAAVATLSAGDLMAYIDCGGPPEDIINLVETRLKQRNLKGMLEEFSVYSSGIPMINSNSSSSSSDDELLASPVSMKSGRYSRSSSYSARITRMAEAIVCYPGSSLVAVMIQAIAHRVSYVWVIEEDCSVVGIVRFSGMLEVFREHLQNMMN